MPAPPTARPPGSSRPGFTLIELLIVIAILGLLLSLLLPALHKAKDQARNLVCITQVRAVALAWNMYLNDSREQFPIFSQNMHWFYGGKHPAISNGTPGLPALPYRPLNPYMGLAIKQERAAEAFRCPVDREIRGPDGAPAVTKGHSTWDYYGNSYMMNWLLLQPWDVENERWIYGRPFTLGMVRVPPAMLILAGDCQWYYTVNDAVWDANFHRQKDTMSIAFLDGHARFMPLVRGKSVIGEYTFSPYDIYVEEEEEAPEGGD